MQCISALDSAMHQNSVRNKPLNIFVGIFGVHENAARFFVLISKMVLNVMWMLIGLEIGIRKTQMIELVSSPVLGTLSSMPIVLSSGVPKCSWLWPSAQQRLNLLRYHLH